MKCNHIECEYTDKVWLPHIVKGYPKGLKSHLFCIRCGTIKNIGLDKAKGRGYFINITSQIKKYLKILGSTVWMRLVVKNLEKIEDFDDLFSVSKYAQEKIYINIIKKYYQVSDVTMQPFL